jgi:predicted double-glycine peptidase
MLRLVWLAIVMLLAPAMAGARDAPVQSLLEQRQEKLVRQQFDLSCGAAALATILNYQHGEAVSERDVALGLISRAEYLARPDILRIRQGFSLLDMARFVERRGYRGEAFGNLTYADLLQLAPAIVPLRLYGYNHFVVFRGALGDNVLLGDPAYGNRTMTVQRFLAAWIAYQDLGRVGFVVRRRDGLIPPNQLSASPADFPILN